VKADANVSSHKVAVELLPLGRELFEKVHHLRRKQKGPRYSAPASKAVLTSARKFASVKKSMEVMASALAPSIAA